MGPVGYENIRRFGVRPWDEGSLCMFTKKRMVGRNTDMVKGAMIWVGMERMMVRR